MSIPTLNRSASSREELCPECHQQCAFCSDYIWMVRVLGCCRGTFGRVRKARTPCACSEAEKGKTCGTCGLVPESGSDKGGGRVIVERRIVGVKPR